MESRRLSLWPVPVAQTKQSSLSAAFRGRPSGVDGGGGRSKHRATSSGVVRRVRCSISAPSLGALLAGWQSKAHFYLCMSVLDIRDNNGQTSRVLVFIWFVFVCIIPGTHGLVAKSHSHLPLSNGHREDGRTDRTVRLARLSAESVRPSDYSKGRSFLRLDQLFPLCVSSGWPEHARPANWTTCCFMPGDKDIFGAPSVVATVSFIGSARAARLCGSVSRVEEVG